MEDTVIEISALSPLSQGDNSILDIDSEKDNSIVNSNSEVTLLEKNPVRPHNGKQIDKIIISQGDNSILDIDGKKEVYSDDVTYSEKDNSIINSNSEVTLLEKTDNSNSEEALKNYVVTYSKEDNSIHGWSINIETNGQRHQQPDVYFKLDEELGIDIDLKSFVLYKKILLFYYRKNKNKSEYKIENKIDYENNYCRSLQLKHVEGLHVKRHSIGFLPNGDIILVSLNDKLKDYKIYKYSKPKTNTISWENYKIYDIEILEGLIKHNTNCFIYQTKLFLFNGRRMYQWNLDNLDKSNRITFEKQYFLSDYTSDNSIRSFSIVINKRQTLLALKIKKYHDKINIFSMETGMWISRLVEFVTLKNGSEVLLIVKDSNNKSRFLDPFVTSNVIDIDDINTDKNIVTKSDKKISIVDNNVSVTDGNNFEQILNTVCIYTKPIFTTIRNMLKDISENDKEGFEFPDNNKIELEYGNHFRFIIEKNSNQDVYIKVSEKSQNNNKWEEIGNKKCYHYTDLISYKQLDNQELVLIIRKGIYIYTIAKDEHSRKLRLRYFWTNKEWNEYIETLTDGKTTKNYEFKSLINNILKNEFKDSKFSLPSPNFTTILEKIGSPKYGELFLDIINDPAEFSKFRQEIQEMLEKAIDKGDNFVIKSIVNKINNPPNFLEKAIEKGHYFTIKSIVDKTIELIKSNDYLNYNYMIMISLISSNLTKLCEHYPNLAMKYISCTSILLDPDCSSISCQINPSPIYTYSKNIYIKPSEKSEDKSSLKEKIEEKEINQIISFIVPFPHICDSTEYDNHWNELIYKRTSVLFSIDKNKTGFKFDPPFISKKLRSLVDVEDVEDKDRQEEEKHQAQIKNMERKLEDMHKLLKDLEIFKNADDNKTNI
ncbi:9574_t:CDS:2 [Rhizophagus irregularis]|nr:9574_t:CDS:2 [Rhizophagus irregularis]